MTTVAPQITRLGTTVHNFYIVADGGRATVVDVGCSRELPSLRRALRVQGMTLDDVEAIVLTHGHADHAGAAGEARKAGVQIRAHHDELPRLTRTYAGKEAVSPLELPFWNLRALRFGLTLARAGVLRQPSVVDPTGFADGEVLDLPGSPVAVHTPGHTEGHTAFHFPAHRALFSGDALVTDGVWTRTGPQVMDERFHHDADAAAESIARLESIDADIVLPGHGEPYVGSPADAVATARRRRA